MRLLRLAVEAEKSKPLAIIIKGNPKYLDDPKVKAMAHRFYAEVKSILVEKGYRVEFDAGHDYTKPKDGAAVWVGHSRGIDRLRYAPSGVKCIELQTCDTHHVHGDNDRTGLDPQHYQLSTKDLKNLKALPSHEQN